MLPLVGKPASVGETFLFVFDFDDTIIRGNSDELVPASLGMADAMKAAYFNPLGSPQWTHLLSDTMSTFSREDVSNIIPKALKMEPAMQELFNLLERLRKGPAPVLVNAPKSGIEHAKAVTVDYVIASDANDVFISESFKQLLGIELPADRIFSNPFVEINGDGRNGDTDKKSRIDWNMPAGTNNCPHCSTATPNMCKSIIVQNALNNAAHHLTDVTLVYVGNGSNDACPIRNVLRARDHAFILKGDKLEKVLQRPVKYAAPHSNPTASSFPQALWADGGAGICNHHIWATAEELLSCVSDLLGQNPTPVAATTNPMAGSIRPPLPPLALFDGEDGIATEFRIKRLWNDIPSLYDRLIISVQEVIDKLENKGNNINRYSSKYGEEELEVLLQGWKVGKDRIALQRKSLFKGSPSWKPLLSSNGEKKVEMEIELPKDAAAWMALIESQDILPVPQQLRNFGDHWTQTPWLHGEIYMSILHWHVLQQAIRTATCNSTSSTDVASWSVDGITSSSLPTINIIKTTSTATNNYEPTVEVSQTPAIDVYATEKDTAINAFALSHIFPMVSIVFTDIELTKEALTKQDDVALRALVTRTVESLLMACTWGNAVDLAMFSNEELAARHLNDDDKDDDKHQCESSKRTASEESQRAKMATNNIPAMAEHIVNTLLGDVDAATTTTHRYIDIVQDNCGVECCADMLFALYITQVSTLLLQHSSQKGGHIYAPLTVRLHTKPVSYFVSDVMPKDIDRMLESWDESAQPSVIAASSLFRGNLVHFDGREEGHAASGGERPLIEIHSHPFWVYPAENADMPPSLARQFFFSKRLRSKDDDTTPSSSSSVVEVVVPRSELVIFKGDLNFRRVCGDRHWNRDMFFKLTQYEKFAQGQVCSEEERGLVNVPVPFTSVLEHYWPYNDVPIAALRTNKSELCVGVTNETMDRLDAEVGPAGWRFSGSYAVALYASSTHH